MDHQRIEAGGAAEEAKTTADPTATVGEVVSEGINVLTPLARSEELGMRSRQAAVRPAVC